MKLLYSIFSFLLGADYEILKLCPIDLTKQIKKNSIAVLVALLTYISSEYIFKGNISLGVAVTSYLIYILFLCKPTDAVFTKFLLTVAIANYIFYGISYSIFGGINRINFKSIEDIIILVIIGIIILFICFTPVRFSKMMSNSFESLYKQKIATKEELGKFLIEEKASADKAIITNREKTRIKHEAQISKYLSDKILQTQKSAIDSIVEKWTKDLRLDLATDLKKYYTYNNLKQEISINKTDEDELNSKISNLIKKKQEEFAQVIINKWANEQKKELENNPTQFIPK